MFSDVCLPVKCLRGTGLKSVGGVLYTSLLFFFFFFVGMFVALLDKENAMGEAGPKAFFSL